MIRSSSITAELFEKFDKDQIVRRLERRTVKDQCWRWMGQKVPRGYGQIKLGGRNGHNYYVHRLSYAIHVGCVPANVLVLHSCDCANCWNPTHLRLGSAAENSADMVARRRNPLGADRPFSKLTAELVRMIRNDNRNCHELALELGISFGHVARIRRREIWKHV